MNDPDAVAKEKEQYKYKKDDESVTRLQSSNSIRFVPATMNQFGRRGPHFEALLREFAAELVTRPAGCKLMKGPYKQSFRQALRCIHSRWGARLTWTAEREFGAQIIKATERACAQDASVAGGAEGPSLQDLD